MISFHDLEIQYDSRSLHQGLFGSGWCSLIESQLVLSSGQPPILQICSLSLPEASIQQKSNPFKVQYEDKIFLFNKKGRLVKLKQKEREIFIQYDKDQIQSIKINQDLYSFFYDPAKNQVIKIAAKGSTARFNFKKDLLSKFQIFNSVGKTKIHSFQYDGLSNLTSLEINHEHLASIFYDNEDRVVRVQTPNQCESLYVYKMSEQSSLVSLTSYVTRRCPHSELTQRQVLSQFRVLNSSELKLIQTTEVL